MDAPVTMLRVYCAWPGLSPMMNERRGCREVAVGDVDRDPLLALGPQPVGDEGQVEALLAAALRRGRDRVDLVVEQALRVVEQPPDERALAVVDRSDGREPQQLARLSAHRSHQK